MALVFADRVNVRSHATGTGSFVLESTLPGYQSFDAVGNGNETYYGIVDQAGNWEIGRGTYTSSTTTLSRDTVISSSNSDALVDFPAGGKNVFGTFPSSIAGSLVVGAGLDLTSLSQNVAPSIDSDGTTGYSLGTANFKWKELFVSNGSVYIGDVKLSNNAGKLVVKKVINAGEVTEEDDPTDPNADSEIGGGGASLGDLEVVTSPGGVDTLQNATTGGNVYIAATESVADLGDGSISLRYIPHVDTTAPYITDNSITVGSGNIVLDAGVNTLILNSEGLDFDEGFKLPRTQAAEILSAGNGIVYTTVAYPRVLKLILKAKLLDDYQACEMMVVRSNSDPVVINNTVYAVLHTSDSPFVTYNAQWNSLSSKIEIVATNLDPTNNIWVESMVIEVLEWD